MNASSACACRLCGNVGHTPSRCPSLHDVLKDGFYSGGGGGGGHSHDDDESLRTLCKRDTRKCLRFAFLTAGITRNPNGIEKMIL